MFRLALCDDDIKFLDSLKELTISISARIGQGLDIEIKCFSDGLYLINDLSSGKRYDLIMLDWDMPMLTGEETGKAIRDIDQDCLIIFITGYGDYAAQASKLTMFRYISKRDLSTDLPEALRAAYDKKLFREKTIQIKDASKTTHIIRLRDIISIENQHAITTVRLKQNEMLVASRSFLSDYSDYFIQSGFIKPFKGILINSREIEKLAQDQVLLSDGSKFPMSRRCKRDVHLTVQRLMETEA